MSVDMKGGEVGMTVENVIRGLECCIKYPNEYGDCMGGNCPYGARIECHKELMQDALALLKAQEPVKPKFVEFEDKGITWKKYEVAICGKCGATLYCPMCGKAVKWDD